LLDYLLEDKECFAKRPNEIIDQLFDFFLAGTNTTSYTTQMLIYHMTKNKDVLQKIRADYQKHVIDPYLAEDASPEEKSGEKPIDILKALTFDRTFELEYFNMVYNETMRFHPVVQATSTYEPLVDVKFADIRL